MQKNVKFKFVQKCNQMMQLNCSCEKFFFGPSLCRYVVAAMIFFTFNSSSHSSNMRYSYVHYLKSASYMKVSLANFHVHRLNSTKFIYLVFVIKKGPYSVYIHGWNFKAKIDLTRKKTRKSTHAIQKQTWIKELWWNTILHN